MRINRKGEYEVELTDWLSILAVVVSFGTLVLTTWLQGRMSASQVDDNVMNAVNSTLSLFEKVKTLNPHERQLFIQLLKEWDYFKPPKFIQERRGSKPSEATVRALEKYFDDLSKQQSSDVPDH